MPALTHAASPNPQVAEINISSPENPPLSPLHHCLDARERTYRHAFLGPGVRPGAADGLPVDDVRTGDHGPKL
jgi:hypothetical protein